MKGGDNLLSVYFMRSKSFRKMERKIVDNVIHAFFLQKHTAVITSYQTVRSQTSAKAHNQWPQQVHPSKFIPVWCLRRGGLNCCAQTGAIVAANPRALFARHGAKVLSVLDKKKDGGLDLHFFGLRAFLNLYWYQCGQVSCWKSENSRLAESLASSS